MGHYKANLRDIEFNLFEVLGRQDVLGSGPYRDLDADTARSMLAEVEHLATHVLAESFTTTDRTPPVYDPDQDRRHAGRLPQGVRGLQRRRLDLPRPARRSRRGTDTVLAAWAMSEMILGANPGVHMYSSGPGFAHVFWALATDEQKKWAGPGEEFLGRHHGAHRARRRLRRRRRPDPRGPQADGTWHIEGVKRFITSAEHDLENNIIHLVLARPVGVEGVGGPGTKGLSLFLVPKFHVDWETGELGDRNGVWATNVEHKMGLKVSTTCELTFGGDVPAVGWLVGEVHDGIAQMFKVIEFARMMVGTKAIATLSTAYLNALDYSKTRLQGADLTQMTDKTAPRVSIIHHPDVRRSLLTQKAYVEAMRGLVLYTASIQDDVAVKRAAGEDVDLDERLNDLLLPIVKGYGSEKSYQLIGQESLQCFGGSGYLQDYPIEQYVRDSKIDTLYEGTTAIQGMDLFFRKIVRDKGLALTRLLTDIQDFAKGDAGNGTLAAERDLLAKGLEDVQGIVGAMVGQLTSAADEISNVYKVGQNTSRLLYALGDLVCAWLLLRHAEVALRALSESPAAKDVAFYEGKVAAAKFFARQVLPQLAAQRVIADSTDNSLMELAEDAF